MISEEEVIANAFKKIRDAVNTTDWLLVCEAFEDITGVKIRPPEKPKSKLEKIREAFNQSITDEIPPVEDKPTTRQKKTSNTIKALDDEKNPLNIVVTEKENESVYGTRKISVFSIEEDDTLANKNKAIVIPKVKEKRNTELKEKLANEEFSYASEPKSAPPWR